MTAPGPRPERARPRPRGGPRAGARDGRRARRARRLARGLARARGRPRQPRARRAPGAPRARLRPAARRWLPRPRHRGRPRPRPPWTPRPASRCPLPAREAALGRRRRHRRAACARCTSRSGATPSSTPAASTCSCASERQARRPSAGRVITYGRLRDEAAAVAGGLRERGVARGRHRRPDAADRARLPARLLRASCSRARSRCRSTRPCASTGSRSTRRASPRSCADAGVRAARHDPARAARGRPAASPRCRRSPTS